MSTDPKAAPPTTGALPTPNTKGVKIFTYPKIIFIWPTLLVSFFCGFCMIVIDDRTQDPRNEHHRLMHASQSVPPLPASVNADAGMSKADLEKPKTPDEAQSVIVRRFNTTQNILAIIFLVTFLTNMIIMAIDFPRFTVFGILLGLITLTLAMLLLNEHFELVPALINLLEGIYAVANAQFYILFGLIILGTFILIYVTRFLDYWVILPNEILHNHGPFSDLERYPTFNLKFDKEIPDILEYVLGRAGRLVLHVANERRAIVLDTVLFINHKETELKKLMSRMEVRVTSDQEASTDSNG